MQNSDISGGSDSSPAKQAASGSQTGKPLEDNPAQKEADQPQLHIQPGTKVIQPSAALLEELKNAKSSEEATTANSNSVTPEAQNPDAAKNPPAPKPVDRTKLGSLYPEATKNVDVLPPPAKPDAVHDEENASIVSPKMILIIRIVTGVLVLLTFSSVFTQLSILKISVSFFEIIGLCIDVLVILLLIYIFILKETARVAYVYVSSVLLVIGVISFLALLVRYHTSTALQSNDRELSRSDIDSSINGTLQNQQYTQEQKNIIVNNLKAQPGYSSSSQTTLKAKRYLSDTIILVTAVGPIIFFTRPSIKKAFK